MAEGKPTVLCSRCRERANHIEHMRAEIAVLERLVAECAEKNAQG